MKTINVLPLGDYGPGTVALPPIALPDEEVNDSDGAVDLLYAGYRVARCTPDAPDVWADRSTRVEVFYQRSYDGGQTWEDERYFASSGGALTAHQGGYVAHMSCRSAYPRVPGRMLRGRLVISGGVLRSSCDVHYELETIPKMRTFKVVTTPTGTETLPVATPLKRGQSELTRVDIEHPIHAWCRQKKDEINGRRS